LSIPGSSYAFGASVGRVDTPWIRHYQPGVPAEIELPTESLVALYERSVAEAGDAVATEFFGRTTTYAELGEQIGRAPFFAVLQRMGTRRSNPVALRPE
jgi:long-chain acyl-CoA synthetase